MLQLTEETFARNPKLHNSLVLELWHQAFLEKVRHEYFFVCLKII